MTPFGQMRGCRKRTVVGAGNDAECGDRVTLRDLRLVRVPKVWKRLLQAGHELSRLPVAWMIVQDVDVAGIHCLEDLAYGRFWRYPTRSSRGGFESRMLDVILAA